MYHCRSNTRVVPKHWLIQENNIWIFQLKFLILGSNNYLKYYILHTCTFVIKEILLSYKWLMKIAQECKYYHHLICNIFTYQLHCIYQHFEIFGFFNGPFNANPKFGNISSFSDVLFSKDFFFSRTLFIWQDKCLKLHFSKAINHDSRILYLSLFH